MTDAPREEALPLGWQTDLIFARFDGEITPRGDHLCVRTPTNPSFWWGNFLLFARAPRDGDLAPWLDAFRREIADPQPESTHRTFGIAARGPVALPEEFAAAGFTLSESTVLTLEAPQLRAPAPFPAGVECRPLDLPRDAAAVVEKQVAVDAHRYEPGGYRLFVEREMLRYGAMQAAGLGGWFGLWAGDVLAASCGLFRDPARGDGLGRFQYVSTHPEWRRRGL